MVYIPSVKIRWGNILLVAITIGLGTVAAEFMVRWLDNANDESPALRHVDAIPLAPGVERSWFFTDPAPLPNRRTPSAEDVELVRRVERSGVTEGTRRADMFKAWNARFVGDPCRHAYLCGAPGRIYVYDPANGESRPPYRFMPNASTPVGLVTNEFGFRGAPLPAARQPRTVRIAFVGASTTVGNHFYPWSYPDFVGHWLNQWAAARKLDLRFEVINAGRESITSSDNVVIVRDEIMPLQPDLLVYYEGANQFNLRTLQGEAMTVGQRPPLAAGEACPGRPVPPPAATATATTTATPAAAAPSAATPAAATPAAAPSATATPAPAAAAPAAPAAPQTSWLDDLAYDSALLRRVQALRRAGQKVEGGGEPAKPDYTLTWPAGLDENDPDITRPDLPINLPIILRDLDAIDAMARADGAELVLASFIWLVRDGMVLDPIRHRSILDYLNQGYAPFRYADLERLAAFENRVFAKYAKTHALPFIDVARAMPFDPDLFIDAIHNSAAGERVRAWIFFQGLVPIVERHLKSGAWPRSLPPATRPPPTFTPRVLTFDCSGKP